ncbi:MAG TPA: PDZ domain-containing protein [Candidatus Acidoferrum sp.]|nr:PDZ domain-containing protein [Candidatus Acidoferrum sp.]
MNKRNILITAGLAALGLVLIALPSPSVPLQETPQDPQEAPAPPQEPATRSEKQMKELHKMVISLGDGNSWLGVETQEVSADTVREFKLPAERGVVIGKVLPDSPAAKAGLKENDVVTAVNGQTVEGTVEFRRMIHEIPAGRKVQLTIWRDDHSQTLEATLGNPDQNFNTQIEAAPRVFSFHMPETVQIPEIPPMEWTGDFLMGGRPRLGVEVEDLQGQLGKYFGAPDGEGILIQSVNSGSPAEKAGIKAGDVIISLNGERIRTVGDLRAKLSAAKGSQNVKVGLLRNKTEMTLSVELPPPATPKVLKRMALRTTI